QVNGEDVEDGGSLDLPPLTTSVEVTVETTDPDATFVVTGDTGLEVGQNVLTVSVTAADGETTADYTVTLNVPLNNDATLSTFQVNGVDVEDGATVEVEYGTTEVDVVATPTDANATVVVVGGTDLQPGENTIVVTVTAEDGETVAEYTVTVKVALNTDTSLAVFAVNGTDVVDGDTVDLEYGVTSVEVIVEPTDPDATFEVEGGADLVSGENTLTVTVTAADGETVEVYTVTLNVAFNSDTSLSVFQVNGADVVDGASVELPAYTTEVEVTAEPTDPDATVEIEGGTELVSGENTLTVTVTAADKETTETYTVTLVVALGNDVTLATFQVNGEDVEDGGSLDLPPLTTSVEVLVETTDPDATFVVEGNTDLKLGANTLTVTVTAADGSTTVTYTVTLNIPLNNDASLSTFQVNGVDVEDGATVDVEYGTTEVEVVATPTDANASVVVVGGTDLKTGENSIVVTVTAQDGETVVEYTVTVNVALNSDTSLATFTLNGEAVNDGDVFDLEYGVTEVEVIALPTDPDATVEIEGGADLVSGENTVTVTVTAADGVTVSEYVLTLNVAFNSDTSLASFQVNGEDVEDGAVIDLPAYTTEVEVTAEATDPDATVEINGAAELSVGENLLIVTVTAADGVSATDYVVTLNVPLGNDVTLATFQVNGEDVEDGGSLDLPPLTTSVEVTVETTDPD
ncbi:MAG: hypothetical protein EB072_14950, partial [Betaproteobacteria bacterium]|nr:hypothetical protein [Betaproteobacteria bacterium]